jgi:hypothetical protein
VEAARSLGSEGRPGSSGQWKPVGAMVGSEGGSGARLRQGGRGCRVGGGQGHRVIQRAAVAAEPGEEVASG